MSDQITIESLSAQLEELKQENSILRDELNSVKTVVEKFVNQPAPKEAPAPVIPKESFTLNGEKYHFRLPVITLPKIGKRTALEILTDETEQAALGNLTIKQWLVANNSKMIEPAE